MGDRRRVTVPSVGAIVPGRFLQICCICALVTYSISAYAHAVLVKAVPGAHSTVAGTAITVTLQFNVRIDPKRSRVALVLPDKSQRLLTVNQPSPELLESQLTGLANGDYSIRWQVLASDGHITQGEIPFKVVS
jgi:copper resistance protein C